MKQTAGLLLLGVLAIIGIALTRQRANSLTQTQAPQEPMLDTVLATDCTPTFVDGGGPYYKADAPFRDNIAPETAEGEELVVSGRVLARDCTTPLSNVAVDIWQANESGNYEDAWYRGQVLTNELGEYQFRTVVPKGYGEGTAFRPPHIHFKIWQDGQELITSQMFLPASRAQGIMEAYIMNIKTATELGTTVHTGKHDIVLP